MRRTLVLLLLAVATTAVVVVTLLVALRDADPEPPAAPLPSTPATSEPAPDLSLAEIDTETTAVRRAAFCETVAPDAIERVLGRPATDTTSYADGQRAQVTGRVQDIAHEFGCGWTAATTTARAWVFAPPITPRTATGLVRAVSREDGCRAEQSAPPFGRPSVALVCRVPRGVQASFRGLFGDAWLTCSVTGSLTRTEALERADRWCVAVLAALSG